MGMGVGVNVDIMATLIFCTAKVKVKFSLV
jgi:hypothetical protein